MFIDSVTEIFGNLSTFRISRNPSERSTIYQLVRLRRIANVCIKHHTLNTLILHFVDQIRFRCGHYNQKLRPLSDTTYRQVLEICDRHKQFVNLTKSISKIMSVSCASVHSKDYSSLSCKSKCNNKFCTKPKDNKTDEFRPKVHLGKCDSLGNLHSRFICYLRNTIFCLCGEVGRIQSASRN